MLRQRLVRTFIIFRSLAPDRLLVPNLLEQRLVLLEASLSVPPSVARQDLLSCPGSFDCGAN